MILSLDPDGAALKNRRFHINSVMVMVIKGNFTNFATPQGESVRSLANANTAQFFYPACC